MNLTEISFPVFKLKNTRPSVQDGIVFYVSESIDVDAAEYKKNISIVDDTNISGNSIGARRLVLKSKKAPLYNINKAIYFLGDLIKLNTSKHWYIDNTGKLFEYKKTSRAKLVCKKISKVIPAKGIGCIVEIQGLPARYKSIFKPREEEIYAGLLQHNSGYILYGYYTQYFSPSWRKI